MRCYLLFPAAVLFCGMVSVILGHTSELSGARARAVDGAGRRQAEEGVASHFGNPFLFTGREYDAETGLYYYRGRYYSPALGRFLNRDPIGIRGGVNLYEYVGNNPVTRTDPSGRAVLLGYCQCGLPARWPFSPTYKVAPFYDTDLAAGLTCANVCTTLGPGWVDTTVYVPQPPPSSPFPPIGCRKGRRTRGDRITSRSSATGKTSFRWPGSTWTARTAMARRRHACHAATTNSRIWRARGIWPAITSARLSDKGTDDEGPLPMWEFIAGVVVVYGRQFPGRGVLSSHYLAVR